MRDEARGDHAELAWASSPRVARALRGLLFVLTGFFLLLFLYTALRRMRYPFELEWIESGMVVSVTRIAHGQGLYVAPTLSFVPFLYAPLYLYIAALLMKVVGPGYTALRLLSTLSTLGTGGVIFALVSGEGKATLDARTRWLAGACGAGLFLACYPLVEAFYDIGRVDSLFAMLFVLAIFFSRRGWPVAAAVAWVLCFQTKQSILPVAVVLLCVDWKAPRRIITGLVTFVVLLGASMAAINHATHGWYLFYLFRLTGGFGIVWRQAVLYLPNALLAPMGVALALAIAALLFSGVSLGSRSTQFYAAVTLLIYAAIGYVAAHAGAAVNALIPVYAWTAVLFGVSLGRLLGWLERQRTRPAAAGQILVLAMAVIQLAMFLYNPGRYLPTARVLAERRQFIEQVRALPGDVYILNHTYDALLAGKQPHAEGEALGAVLDAATGRIREELRAELDRDLAEHRFSAVVLDVTPERTLMRSGATYPMAVSAVGGEERFLTAQPRWIYLPCDSGPATAAKVARAESLYRFGVCPVPSSGEPPAK